MSAKSSLLYILDGSKEDMSSRLPNVSTGCKPTPTQCYSTHKARNIGLYAACHSQFDKLCLFLQF
jgi:hypothetical protein